MITYDQWNKAIISYFFEDCEPGQIVFLQTNKETLEEIAKNFNVADAIESLKEVVRNRVIPHNSVNLWRVHPSAASLWSDCSEEEPPQVAFLALTVLAASLMDSEGSVGSQNYYVRLNELLFDQSVDGAPQGFNHRQFEEFWKHLQRWALDQQNVELYLTEGTPNRRYVWYPISQCLISKYDEHNLQEIFQEANLKPGAYLAESQLLTVLRSCRSFEKLSVKIKRPILEGKKVEIRLILGQIQLLLENWNGEVQERIISKIAKGHRSHTINVQLKFNPFRSVDIEEIRYWFRCKRSPQITFKPNSLNVESLQSDDGEWFEPFVVNANPLSLQVLQNSIEIKSEKVKSLTYRLNPSDIWVFRIASEPDDGWFSQGNLLLHEVHRIVFRKEQNLRVTSILQHVCEPFTPSKSICVDGKKTDWQYIDVKPTVLCKTPILGYRITTSDKISFVGGLSLDKRKNSYFDFCLPAIVVPDHVALSDDPFYFNGKAMNVPSDRKIELTDRLDSGEYHLSYLDSRAILCVISPTCSCEYEKQILAIDIDLNSKNPPSFKDYQISEIPAESKVWLSGAKFFGEDNIPSFVENDEDTSVLSAAELVSSVVKVAIELKQRNTSPPEWLYKAINNLNQDVALQALVKKKLTDYQKIALSYADLCEQIGK